MQTWARVPTACSCGNCRKVYGPGEPMLVIEIPKVKSKKFRGPCCAGEAPPNLPPLEQPKTFTSPMKMLKHTAEKVKRDFKVLQGGAESA